MVVTNGTLTQRFEEIAKFPSELKEHLFFKFSYYLSKEQNESLKIKDSIQDDELGIDFIHTDLRLDYCVNPFYALFNLRNASNIEIFTHEWLINSGKADSVLKLEEVGRHIKYYGGKYTYSMN